MDFQKLRTRYRQFGGFRLVREYARIGVLPTVGKAFLRCLFHRQSFKEIYPAVMEKVKPILQQKYAPVLEEGMARYASMPLEQHRSKRVWFCWLQGLDAAPPLVRACYDSLCTHLADRDITVIDAQNWKDYADLPDTILRKWEAGRIPAAQFSDLLRLQLLIRHGGTWIDATVFCSGTVHAAEYLDADLFLFQYTPPGEPQTGHFSNWFISACTNHPLLLILRDMLFAYWQDYDCTLDYYIMHHFLLTLSRVFPETIAAMPYAYSQRSLVLLNHWGEPFNPEKWARLSAKVSFHKLSFRIPPEIQSDQGNFCNRVVLSFRSNAPSVPD